MQRQSQWRGSLQLTARTAGSFARLGIDFLGEAIGSALPRTEEQIAHPDVINKLTQRYSPPGSTPLPRAYSVRLPGVRFESSNCKNFLLELEFENSSTEGTLPRTLYAKLPCDELMTRSFANTMGFWSLECNFCKHVASHIPIRIPRVYASAQRGSRFVLLLENLNEIPGVKLFTNRDMASGTTPERARRVLRSFAKMHSTFWNWEPADRERLLPIRFHTFLSPKTRQMTRALNAAAIGPAMRAAPEILPERMGETIRLAIKKWDVLLKSWYAGPLTLVHGDSHLGNCFEYPSEEERQVGMIDFQAVHWSKGMRDVQYFLINSLPSDVLEEHEQDLIAFYCDELATRNIALTRGEAFEQYRAFSFQTLMVGVVSLGLGSLTERDTTVRAITQRSAVAVERLGFREWLEVLS